MGFFSNIGKLSGKNAPIPKLLVDQGLMDKALTVIKNGLQLQERTSLIFFNVISITVFHSLSRPSLAKFNKEKTRRSDKYSKI